MNVMPVTRWIAAAIFFACVGMMLPLRFVAGEEHAALRFEIIPLAVDANEGIAAGDIDGDGKIDLVAGRNWYRGDQWVGRPLRGIDDWNGYVQSNGDFLYDINGNGHDYGLYWWKNLGPDSAGKIQWKETLIDRSFSQPHVLMWADLDGDGQDELITGKRYYAHNGKDPGGQEPPCLYYYKWDRQTLKFKRFTIGEGRVGTGLQIIAEDLSGNGKIDIAVAGKSGTYVLLQQ